MGYILQSITKETNCKGVGYIQLTQNMVQWQALLMNLWVLQKSGNF
jgi:hypothetical protein